MGLPVNLWITLEGHIGTITEHRDLEPKPYNDGLKPGLTKLVSTIALRDSFGFHHSLAYLKYRWGEARAGLNLTRPRGAGMPENL